MTPSGIPTAMPISRSVASVAITVNEKIPSCSRPMWATRPGRANGRPHSGRSTVAPRATLPTQLKIAVGPPGSEDERVVEEIALQMREDRPAFRGIRLTLLRKETVLADNASWLFRAAPYLVFAATWVAAALLFWGRGAFCGWQRAAASGPLARPAQVKEARVSAASFAAVSAL